MRTVANPLLETTSVHCATSAGDSAPVRRSSDQSWRRSINYAAKALLAASILTWLVWSGRLDFGPFARIGLSPDLLWLALVVFASLLLPAIRWWWLLRMQRFEVSLWNTISMTWVGYAAALVLPGAAGGDLARGYLMLRGNKEARARAVSTILVDRFAGLYGLLLLGMVGSFWMASQRGLSATAVNLCITLGALVALGAAGVLALFVAPSSRLAARVMPARWLESWQRTHALYCSSKKALAACMGISIVSGMLTTTSLVMADGLLGGGLGWLEGLIVGPLVVLANCLPFSLGGIGIGEAAAGELFEQMGSPRGAEAMLLVRLLIVGCSVFGLFGVLGARNAESTVVREDNFEPNGI